MRERSEMKAHLAANMCRIEQTVPSRTVDAEPDNTLNTLSPGRSSRWILPHELETPDRPTSSGLQSPVGVPVQFGPSPMTREYSATPPAHVPPAQWGEVYGRGSDDGCELFGTAPEAEESDELCPQVAVPQLDELQNAHSPIAPLPQVPVIAARCVNGNLLRPSNAEEDQPSTALQQSEVRAPGGVQLGRGTPGQSPGPGGRRGRDVHPPHCRHHRPHQFRMPVQVQVQCHIQCSGRLCTPDQRQQEEEVHPETPPIQGMAATLNGVIQAAIHQEEALDQEEALGQEERTRHHHLPHQEEVQAEVQDQVQCREELHPSRQEEEQELQGLLHLHLQALHNHHDLLIHGVHLIGPGKHCRSSCYRPTTRLAAYWR